MPQQNKKFKSKHSTKSSLHRLAKGKIQATSPRAKHQQSTSQNRRNHAKQIQSAKKQSILSSIKFFAGIHGTPRTVAVISLTPDSDPVQIVKAIATSLHVDHQIPQSGLYRIPASQFKTSLQFNLLPFSSSFHTTIEAIKSADYVMFCLSPTVQVSPTTESLLRTLQAFGLPQVISVVPSNDPAIHKSLLSFIQYFVPTQAKVYDLNDSLNFTRRLCEGVPSPVKWRDGRSWLVGEESSFVNGTDTLKVTGYLKGSIPLSVNRLVHLPGWGDYQLEKIVAAPLSNNNNADSQVLAEPIPDDADSLVSTNQPDDFLNEQTWPTDEEMISHSPSDTQQLPDALSTTTPKSVVKKKKKVPKGWSEYQAAWIIDSDDEGDVEDRVEKDQQIQVEEQEEQPQEQEPILDQEDDDEDEMEIDTTTVDFNVNQDDEQQQLTNWRNTQHEQQQELDLQFPDEIDTPKHVLAKERFARYRGLKSFNTSPWDPYENLPTEYARIFQFEDFKRTERKAFERGLLDDDRVSSVDPGTRISLYIKNVPLEFSKTINNKDSPTTTTVFGLLIHEHKQSVLNFSLNRDSEFGGVVKSKDPLTLLIGPRRLVVNPIFSTQGNKKTRNNVYKFERFLHGNVVASIFGPVTFGSGKVGCVWLRGGGEESGLPELVGSGTFLNCDTNRVVTKRIVLSGHPFKVHKKSATIRWMFFNSDDIEYFKPIQVYTKHGRTGHIKESLGTHGYFKAHFDGPINQMDTVCMSLYKRVFPKWTTTMERKTVLGSVGNNSIGEEEDVNMS